MFEIIYFLLFIIYIYLVFVFNNFIIEGLFVLINISLIILLKISIKKVFCNLKKLLPIIIFTSIFNIFLGNIYEALLVALKLIIVCNITFVYKTSLGINKIILTIEKLFSPLNFLGISSTDISLMIHIALTFIPNFIKEINEIRISLLAKNENIFSFNYIKYLSKLLLISIFKKTNELDLALKAKGFSE